MTDQIPEKKRSSFLPILLILFVLVLLIAGVGVLAWLLSGDEGVPQKTILEVDMGGTLIEYLPGNDPFAALLMEDQLRQRDFIESIHAAAEDEHVVALVARVTPSGIGLAQLDEVRDAILTFRAAGKPAIAYADTFGEVLPANGSYYLASAFDEVYIQPSGDVGLTGLATQSPFIRGAFDKVGITPEWSTRYEYKTAGNMFTETGYTEPEREALDQLLGSIWDHMLDSIAEQRGIDGARLRELVDSGPILGPQALEAGLVDGLFYRDQVYDRVHELADGEGDAAKLLYLNKYAKRAEKPYAKGDHTVALIYAVGAVQRGSSSYDPFSGQFVMGSDSVAKSLRLAIDDDDVEAIVLRVDSPGGSYVASDTIWREVERAQEAGKPVVVSMANLAASGGYFVSMGADKIVAEPGTITGSIGVLAGKFDSAEMWNKLGITFDKVQFGENAEMWSGVEPFDEAEWAQLNGWLDRVYEDFTSKAAEGRGMDVEALREIAKGRVWSGVDALRLGLVDELGGLDRAISLAAVEAGAAEDASVRVREFPGRKSPFEAFFAEGPENSEEAAVRAAMLSVIERVRPAVVAAERMGLTGEDPGALSMRPIEIE
ncbi:MAG TPA: signal peptide peptidase SppA [Thermoanaerobaculia bacterium]|nr:signal peptide peptidase SppA [Thermoanaerobaculia bacterium]